MTLPPGTAKEVLLVRQSTVGPGRVLWLGVGVMTVVALCVAAVLLAGSRHGETSSPTEDDGRRAGSERAPAEEPTMSDGQRVLTEREALVQDARWYARDMGVPLKEAIRRLQMQDDPLPTNLERMLKKEEPDSYAGLWLRHEPDYGITVALAGDSEDVAEKVRRFVEGTQWEGTVNIKRVEASLSELNAARAEAEEMMDRLGVRYDSGGNIYKNRMEIYVANKERVLRKLDAAGLEIPRHVVLLEGLASPDFPE